MNEVKNTRYTSENEGYYRNLSVDQLVVSLPILLFLLLVVLLIRLLLRLSLIELGDDL